MSKRVFFLKKEILSSEKKEMSQQRTICYLFCICVINCFNEFLHHLFQIETYFQFFSAEMRKSLRMKIFTSILPTYTTQSFSRITYQYTFQMIWPNMAFIMKLILWDWLRFPILTLSIIHGNPCQNYLGTFQIYR